MIDTFYSDEYAADSREVTKGIELLSMRKLSLIAARTQKEGLTNLIKPKDVQGVPNRLKQLHLPAYVDSFLSGKGKLATTNELEWSPQVRDGVLWSVAGTVEGAAAAVLKSPALRVAASISQGFHHAEYDRGSGYCTFNALALAAHELPDKRVFVLDCDEHQGNGTKAFTERLDNLYSFSIYGTYFGNPDTLERAWDREVRGWNEYEAALQEGFLKIIESDADLIIYQAGVDCAIGDNECKAQLTTAELKERDRQVFEFAKEAAIPILFVMAGGYGDQAVDHHVQTFRVANEVFATARAAQS